MISTLKLLISNKINHLLLYKNPNNDSYLCSHPTGVVLFKIQNGEKEFLEPYNEVEELYNYIVSNSNYMVNTQNIYQPIYILPGNVMSVNINALKYFILQEERDRTLNQILK